MLRDAAGLADLNRSDPALIEAVASASGLPGPVTRLLQNAFFRKVDSPLKFDR